MLQPVVAERNGGGGSLRVEVPQNDTTLNGISLKYSDGALSF